MIPPAFVTTAVPAFVTTTVHMTDDHRIIAITDHDLGGSR